MSYRQWSKSALLLGACLASGWAFAQEFPSFQGNSQHTGRHDADSRLNNPDRAFLRWFDPLFELSTVIDNWEGADVDPVPPAGWIAPPDVVTAFGFYEKDVTAVPQHDPYLYASLTPSRVGGNYWEAQDNTQLKTFSWEFRNLNPGEDYGIYITIPAGPTDTDPSINLNYVYPAKYQVYRIDGVDNPSDPGQPIYQRIDTTLYGGGRVRLGSDGANTDQVFRVSSGSDRITVTLLNVAQRDAFGALVDDPLSTYVVYADSAEIAQSNGVYGSYAASPIVGLLKDADKYPWRVYSSRLESFTAVDGSEVKNYSFPVLTSFTHNSQLIDDTDKVGRRNMVWSWPARRPFSLTSTEQIRYNNDRLDWLNGVGTYPGPKRFNQTLTFDNTNGNVTSSLGWAVSTTTPGQFGENCLVAPSVANATESAVFAPPLSEADYGIEVYVPPGGAWASNVLIQIQEGAVTSDARVDMSTASGWTRVLAGFRSSFANTNTANLSVRITNEGNGGQVPADAVRFTRVADLAARNTPVMARVRIRQPDSSTPLKDVVVTALDNGRIYCLDSHGKFDTNGVPTGDTTVYWVYPSEGAADPNHVAGLDGPDGMAEMPTRFDLSSAVVQSVEVSPGNFEDRLYIGSENGRVYCLRMAGNGDFSAAQSGSTTRVWTYPDDYPSASVRSALGSISGSVSYSVTGAGPTLFVPTTQGRLYALDAVGDATNKTTTPRWTYPGIADLPVGPIRMAPVVEFGNVYFGTGENGFGGSNTFFALRADDTNTDGVGDVLWSRIDAGAAAFSPFRNSSPVTIPSTELNNGQTDTVVVANDNFEVAAFDAATGNLIWRTDELNSSPSASLGFSYLRVPNAIGALTAPPGLPTVMVPTVDGRYVALFAESSSLNQNGTRSAWSVTTYGLSELPSMAFGAKDPTIAEPNDDENAWMYGVDGAGFLYAWSYDPDLPSGGQLITPGIPPIRPEPDIEDSLAERLGKIAQNARVCLVTPSTYETLARAIRSGTLSYADIQAAKDQVTRVNYEYGETLYFMIYDLPAPTFTSPSTPYTIQVQLNAAGAATQVRNYAVSQVTGTGNSNNQVVLVPWTLTSVGTNSLVPGAVSITAAILSQERAGANRTIAGSQYFPSNARFFLANPLGIATIVTAPGGVGDPASIGLTTDPTRTDVIGNGNDLSTITGTGVIQKASEKPIWQGFGPEIGQFDYVPHGQTAVNNTFVYDRTMLTLVYGPDRGLQGVRVQLTDLYWRAFGADQGVIKGLDQSLYPLLEDRPGSPGNNTSLDYPDIRKDRFTVVKEQNRGAQNPLFEAVGLNPPAYSTANFDDYRTNVATYNSAFPRNLAPTIFRFEVDVPKFQPPNQGPAVGTDGGYASPQVVYVDNNPPGRQISRGAFTEAYRYVNMRTAIAADERLSVGTPTIDLGGLPSGAGFSPLAPWNNPAFALNNAQFHNASRFPFFGRMTVFNEGNVNLLNVRTAKQVEGTAGVSPLVFQALPNLSPLAQLDMRWHLHSDLDVRFVPTDLPNQQVVFQKARPGDAEPTRLRVNPRVRSNPNLNVLDGDFLGVGSFSSAANYDESKLDPKVGVSIPVGAPTGKYTNEIFVFEDRQTTAADAANPTLGFDGTPNVFEPYNENQMVLTFNVRETRFTNRQTNKATGMVDNLGLTGTEQHIWSSKQPTAARDGNGTLIVAFSSDRKENGATPGFLSRPKTEADAFTKPQWNLYITTLPMSNSITPTASYSPMSDLSMFNPSTNNRWFNHAAGAYPSLPPATVFGIPAGEIDASSVGYRNPAFPTAGTFESIAAPGGTGLTDRGSMYMAFIGEVSRNTAGGDRRTEQRLLIANVSPNGATVNIGAPVALTTPSGDPVSPTAAFGAPSLIQSGNSATVFYTMGTGSTGQIVWSQFNGGGWTAFGGGFRQTMTQSLDIGNAFESVANPTATLRPGVFTPGIIELAFNGRLRGRPQTEAYIARLSANGTGLPIQAGGGYAQALGLRFEPLEQDPATNLYWVKGSRWRTGNNDLDVTADNLTNPLAASFIDIKRQRIVANVVQYESILVQSSRQNASNSPIYSYDTIYGGKAYIDTETGSIRFAGAMIPRNDKLYARYTARILRLSTRQGFNHQGISMVFDNRYVDDISYWLTSANLGAGLGSGARNDRFIMTFVRTTGLGTTPARPAMATYRFGVQLPTAVLTDNQGRIPVMQVTGSTGPYQVDPKSGKVYFLADMAGRNVTVRYSGVDESGRPYANPISVSLGVDLIEELPETTLDLSEVSNETGMSLALDPLGGGFNNGGTTGRRPNLLWMFWNSTRGGGSDVYFQTIAPKWSSVLGGN